MVTATLAWLLQTGLGIQRVSMFYFAAVLICSAWLGLTYGLFASLLATIAFHLVSGDNPGALALGTRQDFTNLIAYAVGAWVIGLYSDELRRRAEALSRLTRIDAAGPLSERAGLLAHDTARVLIALVLTGLAVGLGFGAERALGPSTVAMIYLAAVVASAVALGTRFALITAVSAVVAYDFLLIEPRYTLSLDSAQALLNFGIFAGVAWWVGRFAERARYERGAVQSLFSAGRSLSAAPTDAELRVVICETIAAATGGGHVVIRDEQGGVCCSRGEGGDAAPKDAAVQPDVTHVQGRWRSRLLSADGRTFGSVTWLSPASSGRLDETIDGTVRVLIELGAAALARARLSAENARMEAAANAEQLQRALLASVSHDLRTPLSGILGSADTLLDYGHLYSDDVRRDLLANIREQARRLQRYVENVLGLTRLETGILKPQLQILPLEPLAFEAWQSVVEGVDHRRADIAVDSALEVRVDPGLFHQALANVLDNAVKFSPPGSPVELRSRASKKGVSLVVSDHGSGLQAAESSAVLEPFVRGDGAKAGGFGLGLFIARGFMEAMGGSIQVTTREDGQPGAAVWLTLAAAETRHAR
jgi:K+-sensing histidine kinase KdpD